MTSIFLWLLLLPFKLCAMVLAILLAPTAAALTMLRSDSSLHGALKWMLTTDNSIDALWQQPHHLQSYSWLKNVDPREFERSAWLRWQARMLWLIRNPAGGVSNWLGYESSGQPVRVWLQHGVWDSGETMWLVRTWPGAFQVQVQWFYRQGEQRFLRVNCGWKSVSNRSRLIYTSHINPFRCW